MSLSDIYAKTDSQVSWAETVQWLPIDDMEVTITHKQTQVMPCGLPHYRDQKASGKKNKKQKNFMQVINPRDDRQVIIERKRMQKHQEENRLKELKKQRRRYKKQKDAERQKQLRLEHIDDTLDPYDLFDSAGNVTISGLVKSGKSLFSTPDVDKEEPNSGAADATVTATPQSGLDSGLDANVGSEKCNSDVSDHATGVHNSQNCDTETTEQERYDEVCRTLETTSGVNDTHNRPLIDQMDIDIFTDVPSATTPEPESRKRRNTRSASKHNNSPDTDNASDQISPNRTRSGRVIKPKMK